MNRDMISISKFKSVQKEIIQALSKEYQDFYFELLPDIEYTGDTEVPEPVLDEENRRQPLFEGSSMNQNCGNV